jgi:serine/threonine-protein kinase PknG
VAWHRGEAELARERPGAARAHFDAVYRAVPGELAAKLALGVCAELAGEPAEAAGWYEIVARTDPGYTTATFGLARCLIACGNRAGALAAYERIPESSSSYVEAQTAKIRALASFDGDGMTAPADLVAASARLQALALAPAERVSLTAELLASGLRLLEHGPAGEAPDTLLAGHPLTEHDLRIGLEQAYRALARTADRQRERVELVDRANQVRPRTWT